MIRSIHVSLAAVASGVLLFGCTSNQHQAAVPAPASPALLDCRATTPKLRTDNDGAARHKHILAEVSRGGHEICFLGASIMERWETTGKEPWNAIWLPRHAVDCGISGDRTQHVLARLNDGLLDALVAPNNNIRWVVLNIGSNNTDVDTGAEIAAGTEAIIQRLQSKLPNVRIALILLLPRGQWPNPLRDTIASSQAYLRPLAASDPEHIRLIDIGAKFLRPNGELPAETMPDFLHPAPPGYVVLSDELAKLIR